ncbi:MAG: hypothetical protein HC904_02320 [Blastochloris sp.]|nr:hypothetical protein [Blastochloris sp.]
MEATEWSWKMLKWRAKKAGISNQGQVLSLANFSSKNSVPAMINQGLGAVTLIGADLQGSGPVAIVNQAGFYGRDIRTSGYERALDNEVKGRGVEASPRVSRWRSLPRTRSSLCFPPVRAG